MPHITDIQDTEVRTALEHARGQMRAGKAADAIRACAQAYLRLVDLHPDELDLLAPPEGRTGPDTLHWPDYGARLLRTGQDGRPQVVLDRERFALTEAIAYLEFVLGRAAARGA